jgi:hypothetical protein
MAKLARLAGVVLFTPFEPRGGERLRSVQV